MLEPYGHGDRADGRARVTVSLRPWEAGDVDAIVAGIDDEVVRWIPLIPRPYRREHALEFLANPPEDVGRAVVLDAAVVGAIGLRRITSGGGHVGYWCAPRARRRGVMTDALRQFCGHALGE